MKRKTLFVLCALVPAVGSSLGAYYIGRRQASPVVFEVARPAQITDDNTYAYPGATLVSKTTGSGTQICSYLTTDNSDKVLSYYREKLTGPAMRDLQAHFAAMQSRVSAMRQQSRARLEAQRLAQGLPALPPTAVAPARPFPSGGFSSSSSWGSGSSRVSIQGNGEKRTGTVSTSNNEREITVTVDSEGSQTRIRTVLINK